MSWPGVTAAPLIAAGSISSEPCFRGPVILREVCLHFGVVGSPSPPPAKAGIAKAVAQRPRTAAAVNRRIIVASSSPSSVPPLLVLAVVSRRLRLHHALGQGDEAAGVCLQEGRSAPGCPYVTALTMRTISRFSSSGKLRLQSPRRFCWAEIFPSSFRCPCGFFSTVAMCANLLSKPFSPGIVPPQALDRFQIWPGVVLQRAWPAGTGPGWWSRSRMISSRLMLGQKKQEDLPGWGSPASSMAC